MKLGINGRFYGARVTGVQRFAREVVPRLLDHAGTTLFLPAAGREDTAGSALSHLPADSRLDRGRLGGHAWEQLELPLRARRQGCTALLHLGGTAPAWGEGNIVVLHDILPLTDPAWFTRRFALWFRLAAGRAAKRAAGVITTSAWAAGEVARRLAIPRERIRVVSQGLSPFDRPAAAEAVERARRRHGLPDRYILATGAGDPRKNIAFLVAMAERWRARSPGAPALVLVGDHAAHIHAGAGTGRNGRVQPERSGAPIVRRLGYVEDDDLHALYTGASAFCFPSLAEGFGRPPLEAMACGTPVVVGRYAAAREVLGDADCVLPLDADAWIDRLDALAVEGSARGRAIEEGLRIAGRYDWGTAAQQLLEACRDLSGRAEAR